MLEIYGKEYDVHWGTVTNTWTKVTRIVARSWIEVSTGHFAELGTFGISEFFQ